MNLPNRKPTRLKKYDYSQNGAYFITICTHNKQKILCDIAVGDGALDVPKIQLSQIGNIVEKSIEYINNKYNDFVIDKYVVMPNHIHLIVIKKSGGDGTPPLRVCDIIGRLKSFTNNKYDGVLWQRSFHDRIIRGENDYLKIWNYIDTNPQKWTLDKYYE